MDYLSRLPIECLEQIIHYLVLTYFRSRHPLVSLCQVNKHISTIATPFMYRNTLQVLGRVSINEKKRQRSRILLQTLISNIPTSHLHPALLLGLGIENNTINAAGCNNNIGASLPYPTRLNILRLTYHLNLMLMKYADYDAQGNERDLTTAELDYIHGQEFLDMYLADRKDATCLQDSHSKDRLLCYYHNIIYREAIWSLAEPILEQLETLTIVLSDLDRYHKSVSRLAKLEHLYVTFDMVFDCECCTDTPEAEPRRQRHEETLGLLVQFVKDLIKHFPGQLKSFNGYDSGYWKERQFYPRAITDEIYRIIPAYYKPVVIEAGNWGKISVHLSTIDFGRVFSLRWFPPNIDIQHLLQRCRSLGSINVHSLVPKCFDWALQEKKDMERAGQGHGQAHTTTTGVNSTFAITRSRHHNILSDTSTQPAWSKYGLVKIQDLYLQEYWAPSRDLDTIAIAFSQYLKVINIKNIQADDHVQMIHIGHSWNDMPSLRYIRLITQSAHLRIAMDPHLIAQCPSLKTFKIKDQTFEYSCQDITPCLPAHLPHLTFLYLKGWNALTFNPATLESAKNLTDINLHMARPNGYCFIPPVNELDGSVGAESDGRYDELHSMAHNIVRPTWTWDWHLPNLTELTLSSEFAYRFEFRMLQGCPSLEIMRLHMRTIEGHHIRLISEADLFIPGSGDDDEVREERIVAPNLRKLYMNGRWMIGSPSVLQQLLGGMFPKLERLVARGWDGVTVRSMVEAIRTTAGHIRMVRTDLGGPLEEEEVEMRMCRRSCIQMKTRAFLRNRVFFSGVEYVLRDDGVH
ncbi:hypothetical protein EC991_005051 [Linnemannia zychae]|nr:hypothetical protein EC991_005051 [Linnemannia zychae]